MILITGASGQLASQIVAKAHGSDITVHTASRASSADRVMDFDKPETLDFSGVDTLFLTSAGYGEDDVVMRRHGAVVDAARTCNVKHIVYSSLSSASDHLGFALAHRWTERTIQNSGLNWTILRNGLYAELIGGLATPREGRITTPFGQGRISAVARADLADAALAVLKDPQRHAARCYELSGTTAFSLADVATRIGVSYAPVSLEAERKRLASLPLLAFQAPLLLSIASAATAGFLETKTTDLKALIPTPKDALVIACSAARIPA